MVAVSRVYKEVKKKPKKLNLNLPLSESEGRGPRVAARCAHRCVAKVRRAIHVTSDKPPAAPGAPFSFFFSFFGCFFTICLTGTQFESSLIRQKMISPLSPKGRYSWGEGVNGSGGCCILKPAG